MAGTSKKNFLLKLKSLRTQIPAMLCLEHLHSEYSSLKSDKAFKLNANDEAFIKNLFDNRDTTAPTWHDLYRFELILANHLPAGKLRGKVVRLRSEYRSVAGQKEFDDYMASKPPDLQSPPNPKGPPDKHTNFEKLVRDDLKDLLDRLYLRYAIVPIKEKKLNKLTAVAAGLCLISLLVLLGTLVVLFTCPRGLNSCFEPRTESIASLTILIVAVTGAMGGFVSALQRIQTKTADGDSIYNLSVLFYGSYSVFAAPITGAIFAILLYMMFTSGVLKGDFFPEIYTPPAKEFYRPLNPQLEPAIQVASSETNNIDAANANVNNAQTTPLGNEAGANTTSVKTPSNIATPSQTATPVPTPLSPFESSTADSLSVMKFLVESGPAGGKDYALLILWCFIAGFAERFVPDALDRFVKRGSGDGDKT